ncbi:hypothetical protein Q3G72_025488 [Acer saccharum]|nr:hypothetical protein Q3G72_025488 [Acer saccharum]
MEWEMHNLLDIRFSDRLLKLRFVLRFGTLTENRRWRLTGETKTTEIFESLKFVLKSIVVKRTKTFCSLLLDLVYKVC